MKKARSPKPAARPAKPQGEDSRSGGANLFDQLGSMPLGSGQAPQNKPRPAPQSAPQPASQDFGGAGDTQGGGDPLSQLLGGLMGGGGSASATSGGDPLSGLLGSLGGGATSTGGGLSDLLGGLMGGGQGAAAGQAGSDPLSDLLGSLMGGGQGAASQGGGDPLSGLLGGLMAGGNASPSTSGGLGGAAQFFLGKLMGGASGGNAGDLMQMLSGGQRVGRAHLRTSGLAQEYAQQAGLDDDTASDELEKVVGLLQQRMRGGQGG